MSYRLSLTGANVLKPAPQLGYFNADRAVRWQKSFQNFILLQNLT
jgi:hypothetical protein